MAAAHAMSFAPPPGAPAAGAAGAAAASGTDSGPVQPSTEGADVTDAAGMDPMPRARAQRVTAYKYRRPSGDAAVAGDVQQQGRGRRGQGSRRRGGAAALRGGSGKAAGRKRSASAEPAEVVPELPMDAVAIRQRMPTSNAADSRTLQQLLQLLLLLPLVRLAEQGGLGLRGSSCLVAMGMAPAGAASSLLLLLQIHCLLVTPQWQQWVAGVRGLLALAC